MTVLTWLPPASVTQNPRKHVTFLNEIGGCAVEGSKGKREPSIAGGEILQLLMTIFSPLWIFVVLWKAKWYTILIVYHFVSCPSLNRFGEDVIIKGFPCGSAGKESAWDAEDLASIPGWGRSPGEGKGYPLQYSGLENSMECIAKGGQRVGHNWATFTFTFIWLSWCYNMMQ